jgi:hypothetical protein
MELRDILQRLDAIGDVSSWPFDRDRARHSIALDGYTLHIEARSDHYVWRLEHERYGVFMHWAPAKTRAKAREEALTYWRAHLQAHFEHTHAE